MMKKILMSQQMSLFNGKKDDSIWIHQRFKPLEGFGRNPCDLSLEATIAFEKFLRETLITFKPALAQI